LFELLLKARRTHAAVDERRALDEAWNLVKAGRLDPRYFVISAAVLGQLDDAFAALDTPSLTFDGDNGYLFEPAAAALRRDPRFWPVAEKAGLVAYWRARTEWPDFCAEPGIPFDCRTEAARVLAARRNPG